MNSEPLTLEQTLASFNALWSPRIFTVPRGTYYRPAAPSGASILMFDPAGTLSVGGRHGDIPSPVDATTGHELRP